MKPTAKKGKPQQPGAGQPTMATRVLRIGIFSSIILGVLYRLADPQMIASDPELWPLPYSMAAILAPIALGVWAFENTAEGPSGVMLDALWSILVGTSVYLIISFLA